MAILIIIKDLIEVASHCFASRIILKYFKEFITMVLYKEKKLIFLSSYKPITFKNMLVKILKKHVANIIFKIVEDYRLFF